MMQQSLSTISLIDLVTMASSTISMTSLWLDIGILFSVLMALWAFSFSSFRNRTMPTRIDSILNILTGSAPIKICQAIIVGIIIAVTAPQSVRPRADKSLEHQHVNRHPLTSSIAKEGDGIVPTDRSATSNQTLREYSTLESFCGVPITLNFAIQGSHAPFVRYLVARIIDYWFPFLFASHLKSVTLSKSGGLA